MIENYFIFYKLHRIRSNEDKLSIKSLNDLACNISNQNTSTNVVNQNVATNTYDEKKETKRRLRIFLPYFIMLVIVLYINISNLFFNDISSKKGFITYVITLAVFVLYSLIISHIVDKVVEKEIDIRLMEYRDDMLNLSYYLKKTGITNLESYTFLINEVDKKLLERRDNKKKLLDYTGKFIVCAFLPVAAAIFGTTKIVAKNTTDYSIMLINVFLMLGLFYVIYMCVIKLSDIKNQKTMDLERMHNDLSWISVNLMSPQNNTNN